jgi:predicted DNA-binding protein with PD1-like motif
MKSQLLDVSDGRRTVVAVLDPGDEVVAALTDVASTFGLDGASLSGIGGFSGATLGFFDPSVKDYARIPIAEQVEVVSLLGDIALHEGKPKIHVHVVVSRRDGRTAGGHVLEAHVEPTLEVVLEESPSHLRREIDDRTGLPLIRLEGASAEAVRNASS